MEQKNDKYLTIHGHFYQPPRENPWLEEIEVQESAKPFHNWNERIAKECYEPNSTARIVDGKNKILNITNNYELMSFNFGPTLLSWMEKYSKKAYRKILLADKNSRKLRNGHSNAIAQVYNHIIMPLANENDKRTQIIWGIKDYEYRFGHKPEGMWLAETAVDDETLEILTQEGIKFTILSPYQAKSIRKIGSNDWQDVSWGTIDPSMPYRYFSKDEEGKYIDLFFYDGTISKAVAFDNLLTDGEKFAYRLNDGYSESRHRPQLVNIGTDGESYGHHTKFGEMALSYVLSVKAKELGFQITNYGEFLEKFPPSFEVEIKQNSSWSCCHGVGRWREDCGCSTGGQPGWNQRWRAPLRQALDYLRDELLVLCRVEGSKYFKDFFEARNDYIEVILNRTKENVDKFLKEHSLKELNEEEKVKALQLLEIQRQAMLMYTSCGWFFSEISGIETVQIMKYAACAMGLAKKFTDENYEKKFLNILSEAKSNITHLGDGKNIYEKFVKPSVVTVEQIVGHWAISSVFEEFKEIEDIYCYKMEKIYHQIIKKDKNSLITGRVEVTSNVTFERWDMIFAITFFKRGEAYCVVKPFVSEGDSIEQKNRIQEIFSMEKEADIKKALKECYGEHYFTLKEVLIDRRKVILEKIIEKKLISYGETYEGIYDELKISVKHLMELGMDLPDVFRISAKYAIGDKLRKLIQEAEIFNDNALIKEILLLKIDADTFKVNLNKSNVNGALSEKLENAILKLTETLKEAQGTEVLSIFNLINLLDLDIEIKNAQDIYFDNICKNFDELTERINKIKENNEDEARKLVLFLLSIGDCLNIDMNFYRPILDRVSLPN